MSEKKYFSLRLIMFSILLLLLQLRAQENFWQQTNGPYGCSINDMAIGPEGRIYAATDGSGIYRSDDGVDSWININEGLAGKNILAVAVNDSGHVFIGIDHDAPEGDIIYRSLDYGETWIFKYNSGPDISDIVIDKNGNIYVSDKQYSIQKSTDNGDSWVELYSEGSNTPVDVYQMAVNDSGIYVASTSAIIEKTIAKNDSNNVISHDGVFFSKDEGLTWKKLIRGGFSSVSCNNTGLIIGGIIFSGKLYTSNDYGNNWQDMNYHSSFTNVKSFLLYDSTTIFSACENGLFKSENSGIDWKRIDAIASVWVNSVIKDPADCIYIGTSSNILTSEDEGDTWEIINDGIFNPDIYSLTANNSGLVVAGGHKGGIFVTSNKGMSWESRNQQMMSQYSIYSLALNSKGRLFVGTSQPMPRGNLFYTDDYGLSWQTTPIYELQLMFEEVWAMTVDQNDYLYLGTNGDGILYSDNDGDSLKFTNLYGGIVRSMATAKTGEILAGVLGNGIVFSPDKGKTWVKKNNGLDDLNVYAITPVEDNVIYIGNGKGLYKTTDNGSLWNKVDMGIPETAVSSIVSIKNAVYVGTFEKGVFYSPDNGINWHTIDNGLLDSLVWAMTIDSDGYLYAGTNNGVFRSIEPVTSIGYSSTLKMTDSFILYQNYPNPFNPQTTITFSIPEVSNVKLIVYNLHGQKIRTLVNGRLIAGHYNAVFNSNNLSSGVYFYSLQTVQNKITKCMLVIK